MAEATLKLAALPRSEHEKMGPGAKLHVDERYAYGVLAQKMASALSGSL
ncbi:hypothetical protein [Chelativorans alearense]|nr:hypothetical protein [Chelativorans alearense]